MRIYLDNNATTPLDPRVFEAMQPFFCESFGNAASSEHCWGWDAATAVDLARVKIAALIGADPHEIFFTSSATEACNLAVQGLPRADSKAGGIVTSASEHDAILGPIGWLSKRQSVPMTILPTDRLGRADSEQLHQSCSSKAANLAAFSLANHEIGTVINLAELARIAHAYGLLVLADLTQALGKIKIDVKTLGVDMAAMSAHKIYGPKGVGVLYVRGGRREIQLEPLLLGGSHERGLRAGTLNVPAIVGFGRAAELVQSEMHEEIPRITELRDQLESALIRSLSDVWINGDPTNRLGNTTNLGFRGVDGRTLIRHLHNVACSTKSACSSGEPGPSHVLKAIGLSDQQANSCVRFSLGRFTTAEEIEAAIVQVTSSVTRLSQAASN